MSKLLRRAKVCLVTAQSSYKRMNEDDAFLDKCCFELQQSIEMSLKFIIELGRYPFEGIDTFSKFSFCVLHI